MILSAIAAGAVLVTGAVIGRRVFGRGRRSAPPGETSLESGEAAESPGQTSPEDPIAVEIREADRWMGITGAGLGLKAVGALGVPALGVAAIPLLVVPLVPMCQIAWQEYQERKTIGFTAMMAATGGVVLIAGQFVVMGIGVFVFNGGRRALLMSKRRAHDTLVSAFGEWKATAVVLRDGHEVEIPLEDVRRGDLVVIRPGRPIPVDGELIDGEVAVDQRMFTGESRLVERAVGEAVMAASLTVSGRGVVRADRTGAETQAVRLEQLINDAESYEQGLTMRALDIADRTFAPTIGLGALATLARGPLSGVAAIWGNCIDMFWLSAPISVLQTVRAAADGGILVKDGRSLDVLGQIDTVVFDKTGTLTLDSFTVRALHAVDVESDLLLARAAAAEKGHEHPIARAILEAAVERGIDIAGMSVESPSLEVGMGLRVAIDGQETLLGSRRLLERSGVTLPETHSMLTADAEALGHTVVHLALDARYVGAIELQPEIRAEARGVVERLHARGIEVMILTGDEEAPARHLAEVLGIDRWFSRTLPEQKDQRIAELVESGRRVCFVGDGVNDALAMRRAHASISMAGASAVAVDSAQIVLSDGSLTHLDAVFELGRWHDRGQKRLLGAALASTAANVGGVILAGFPILLVLGVYTAGLGVSLGVVYQQGRFVPEAVEGGDGSDRAPVGGP